MHTKISESVCRIEGGCLSAVKRRVKAGGIHRNFEPRDAVGIEKYLTPIKEKQGCVE